MDLKTYHNYMRGKNKYGAIKTEYAGVIYDSKAEANRAMELDILEKKGLVKNIQRQVKFPITIKGKKVFTYIADFVYDSPSGKVVEDVKGVRTAMFNLKKKCVEAEYDIIIHLV
jgi:hypothetical protein